MARNVAVYALLPPAEQGQAGRCRTDHCRGAALRRLQGTDRHRGNEGHDRGPGGAAAARRGRLLLRPGAELPRLSLSGPTPARHAAVGGRWRLSTRRGACWARACSKARLSSRGPTCWPAAAMAATARTSCCTSLPITWTAWTARWGAAADWPATRQRPLARRVRARVLAGCADDLAGDAEPCSIPPAAESTDGAVRLRHGVLLRAAGAIAAPASGAVRLLARVLQGRSRRLVRSQHSRPQPDTCGRRDRDRADEEAEAELPSSAADLPPLAHRRSNTSSRGLRAV